MYSTLFIDNVKRQLEICKNELKIISKTHSFSKALPNCLQSYTTDITMLSPASTHSAINTMTASTAKTIDDSTMHGLVGIAPDEVVDLTDNDSPDVSVNAVVANFVPPEFANRASLKDDFEAAASHLFLSSEVSSLFSWSI